jgi:glucosamine--fructose-6-phosphate aminotransferase (isomerizing)
MCGIVGAVAQRNVAAILLEGLRRLEYRGYDSAGMVVMGEHGELVRRRAVGKVKELAESLQESPLGGHIGIAHTRWATHGGPSENNAHPHISRGRVAVVHNGIIENYLDLRTKQTAAGYQIDTETDTETIAHEIDRHLDQAGSLLSAVRTALPQLRGAYAIAVIRKDDPQRMVVARLGSPLVIGIGIGEHFVASDVAALLPVTQRFIFLQEGDVAEITESEVQIFGADGQPVAREITLSQLTADAVEKGRFRHYMLKEIYEQPKAIRETLEGRITKDRVLEQVFGNAAPKLFAATKGVHIIACGTSYHSAMVARYWIESRAGLPCSVEIASEYRYRRPVVPEGTLFVTLSQSGETADTLAALRMAKSLAYIGAVAICNAPESSLVRESDLVLMTRAGPEIGVASTKAFTTQLVAMMLLTISLGRHHGLSAAAEAELVRDLAALPELVEQVLRLDDTIAHVAEQFIHKHHALFLGRGEQFPIALEGALKLKEISYIHAEAYAAGELKHGPIALVDEDMPVVAIAAHDDLLEKLLSNLQEVRARGGQLFVFAGEDVNIQAANGVRIIQIPCQKNALAPVIFTLPLQLLAYHVAVLKGTDVDQPRNLAKSVTVE